MLKLLQRPPVSLLQEEPLTLQGLYSPLSRPSVTDCGFVAPVTTLHYLIVSQ